MNQTSKMYTAKRTRIGLCLFLIILSIYVFLPRELPESYNLTTGQSESGESSNDSSTQGTSRSQEETGHRSVPDAVSAVAEVEQAEEEIQVEIQFSDFKYPYLRVEKDAKDTVIRSMVADHMLVQVAEGIPDSAFRDALNEHQLAIRKVVVPGKVYLIEMAQSQIPDLTLLDQIQAKLDKLKLPLAVVEPDFIVSRQYFPNDPDFNLLWGLHNEVPPATGGDISAHKAWQITTDAREVVVAVIDTGIEYTHHDLHANMWVNPSEIAGTGIDNDGNGYIDDVYGYDFYNDNGDPMDDNFHGTHCAGTIGAIGDNGIGVTGTAWSVQLMALKFLNASGRGTTSDAIAAINYAADNGAQILSNSWGGSGYSNALYLAIKQAGILCVAAAGNSGQDADSFPLYPAAFDLDIVISVAATDRFDKLASFSTYGLQSVDLAAPGVSIYSTGLNDLYMSASGTSMAAPHVSGACALLLGLDPTLSPAQIKLHLLNSTDPIPWLETKVKSGGRLNLNRFIRGLSDEAPIITSPDEAIGYIGKAFSYQITAENYPQWFAAESLPNGLQLDRTSGVLSGTVQDGGIFNISVAAGNVAGIGTASLQLTIKTEPPLIDSPLEASGQQGAFFLYSITATPSALSFSANGLPAGLNLHQSSGIISGYPEEHGNFNVTLTASNTGGEDTKLLQITIAPPTAPVITSPLEISAIYLTPFSFQIKATNKPTSYSASELPAGLSLNSTTGLISGTPSAAGSFLVNISAANDGGNDSQTLSISVNLPDAPAITSPISAEGQVGIEFDYTITASNSPSLFTANNLPAGLGLNAISGLISGTPSENGIFEVVISAENAGGTGLAPLTLTILPEAPTITSETTIVSRVGDTITHQITTEPAADSFSANNLPAGLTLNPYTGEISGQISQAGIYSCIVSATNSGGTGSANVLFDIRLQAPEVSSPVSYSFEIGDFINIQIEASNSPTSFSATNLPPELSIDSASGRITGAFNIMGTHHFEVFAHNSGGSGSTLVTLNIIDGPTRITAFSPELIDPYEAVTIYGVGFNGTTGVYFSDRTRAKVPAESFTVLSDNEIEATVPYLRIIHESDRSRITVESPRGLAVALAPSTIEVFDGYNAGGSGGSSFLVHAGGALVGSGGGGHQVAIKGGGSAQLGGGGHTFYVESGGFLNLSNAGSGQTVYYSKDSLIVQDIGITSELPSGFHLVPAVRATIMETLLNMRQLPQISSAVEDAVAVAEDYQYQITTSRNAPAGSLSYAVINDLPDGLTFDTASGRLSGSPATPGTYAINFEVTNSMGTTAFTFTLHVTGSPIPVILGSSKIIASSSDSLSYTIEVLNTASSFAASSLPAGLSLDPASGEISGTPTSSGVYEVTITATNNYGSSSRQFIFYVDDSPLTVTSFSPQSAASGSQLTIVGTGLNDVVEVYFLTRRNKIVSSSEIDHISDEELKVILPSLGHVWYDNTPIILKGNLRSCVVFPQSQSNYNVVATGDNFSAGGGGGMRIYVEAGGYASLEGGGGGHALFLEDGASGNLIGGGGYALFYSPSSTVLNPGSTSSLLLPSLSISRVPQVMLNVYDLPVIISGNYSGIIGSSVNYQIESNRHPSPQWTYQASNLPAGLSIDSSSGLISGQPAESGTFEVELGITDNRGTGTKTVDFSIDNAPLPHMTSAYRIDAESNMPINFQITADNLPTHFLANSLPLGIEISASGLVTGQINTRGVWLIPLEIVNAFGSTYYNLLLAIDSELPEVNTMPATAAGGATIQLGGQNLGQVTTAYFSDRNTRNNLGEVTNATETSLDLKVPANLNMLHQPGSLLTLIGPGGATVIAPGTLQTIPAGSSSVIYGGGQTVYVETGGYVTFSGGGGQTVFAENGATVDFQGAGGSNFVIHAPNAILLHANNATTVPVNDIGHSLVPNYLQILPIPVINSALTGKAYKNIPFYYTLTASNSPTSFNATELPDGLIWDGTNGTIYGSPSSPGNYTIQLYASNVYGTAEAQLHLSVGDPFEYWKETVFAALDGGSEDPLSHDLADPDNDGISNLMEFAGASDPFLPNHHAPLHQLVKMQDNRLELHFRRRKGNGNGDVINGYIVDGIKYTVQMSEKLDADWHTGSDYFEAIGNPKNNGDGTETVVVRLRSGSYSSAFVRVKVERVAPDVIE